ncbi:MAG: YdcF family protein [Oscillospiraceae bacterium]|nr:YdcF family protein [Oscillospiraceae bacterium]
MLLLLGALGLGALLGVNAYVKGSTRERILTPEEAVKLEDMDCVLVLGCGVMSNGKPSAMLRDRLIRGIELYESGVAPKLLMSGDHGRVEYDEVNTMKGYAMEAGIPSEDIFMDHAGFSTYESMYRAKEIFRAKRIVIVSQEYHLYRAIYAARRLGLEAYGVSADLNLYAGQTYRDCREILARCKDFFTGIFRPEPTFLGEAIPVNGNGDLTNDK